MKKLQNAQVMNWGIALLMMELFKNFWQKKKDFFQKNDFLGFFRNAHFK